MKIQNIRVADIEVGERVRKHLGDLESLKDSMQRIQLQAIGVEPNKESGGKPYRLMFGARRLEAAHQLGWETISAAIITSVGDMAEYDRLRMENDENVCRRALTLTEAWELWNRLAPFESALASARQKAGKKVDPRLAGKSIDRAATATGFSGITLHRYDQLKTFVEKRPENKVITNAFNEAVETGKVNKAWQAFVMLQRQSKGVPLVPNIEDGVELRFVFGNHENAVNNAEAVLNCLAKGDKVVYFSLSSENWVHGLRCETSKLAKACHMVEDSKELAEKLKLKLAKKNMLARRPRSTGTPVSVIEPVKKTEAQPDIEATTVPAPEQAAQSPAEQGQQETSMAV